MGAAAVQLSEIDLSTSVASFAGVYGAIVVPAKKGLARKPQLMVNDSQFLLNYTKDKTIPVGADLSHYSAVSYLQRANKLWVNRVHNGALFGGVVVKKSTSIAANAGFAAGQADPTAFVFAADDAALIFASSQGAFANAMAIKIVTVVDNPLLQEPNSFQIQVFKNSNLNVPIEKWLVSLTLGQKDAAGNPMYIEDVLKASSYISAFVNPANSELLPKSQAVTLAMLGGADGAAVTDSHMIAGASDFSNAQEFPVTLIMDGGWSTAGYGQALDALAQSRQDCVAILTTPYAAQISATYMTDIINYRKTTLNLNSSYSALYVPHVKIQDIYNNREIFIAPDGLIASAISLASQQYEIWYPPAGFKRGILNVKDVVKRFQPSELDTLADNGINPIRFTSGKGIVVWGQKTLLARQSALSRMNVRLMLIVIEPAIKEFLGDYLFDLNDESVQGQIVIKLEAYLETIKTRKGMYAYKVICDASNNTAQDLANNTLNVDIYVQPTSSIEAIPVRVVITPASISFDQAAAAV